MSSKSSNEFYEYATVNSEPSGTELGYWTNPVSIRYLSKKYKIDKVFFSIRESESDSSGASDTSIMTVTLQFKCEGDSGWQDYLPLSGTAIAVGNRFAIEDTGKGILWRAGVKDGDYISGSLIFGFDW